MPPCMECRQIGRHKTPPDPEANLDGSFFLDREERLRDRALFDPAIYSKLRGCNLVKIKIADLVSGSEIRTRSLVIQKNKTARTVRSDVGCQGERTGWLERRGGTMDDYDFPSRVDRSGHLSTRQYARVG